MRRWYRSGHPVHWLATRSQEMPRSIIVLYGVIFYTYIYYVYIYTYDYIYILFVFALCVKCMHVIQCLQYIYIQIYCVCANYTCIRVLYLYDTIIFIYTYVFTWHKYEEMYSILFIYRRMLVWLTSRPETTAFTVSFVVGTPCSMPYFCWWNNQFSIERFLIPVKYPLLLVKSPLALVN